MDYGHELHFGVFLPPLAGRADQVVTAALEADLLGLDSVSVQDHPYQPSHLDAWTLLTHIAARTERVTVFPNVANLPLRPPAVLARAADAPGLRGEAAGRAAQHAVDRRPLSYRPSTAFSAFTRP